MDEIRRMERRKRGTRGKKSKKCFSLKVCVKKDRMNRKRDEQWLLEVNWLAIWQVVLVGDKQGFRLYLSFSLG